MHRCARLLKSSAERAMLKPVRFWCWRRSGGRNQSLKLGKVDILVIPKIPEVVTEKKSEVKQIVDTKPKTKRKRQKRSRPEIVMTEFGKTVIKRARGSMIWLTAADMRADAIFIEV